MQEGVKSERLWLAVGTAVEKHCLRHLQCRKQGKIKGKERKNEGEKNTILDYFLLQNWRLKYLSFYSQNKVSVSDFFSGSDVL